MKLFVDGCCNRQIGSCASIVDFNGEDLIEKYQDFLDSHKFVGWFNCKRNPKNGRQVYEVSFSDVSTQQNNGAELVAATLGILIALEYGYDEVFSDSQLIVNYWSKKLSSKIKDERKLQIQELLIELTRIFNNRGGKLTKISGDDNIADLGFHKKIMKKISKN